MNLNKVVFAGRIGQIKSSAMADGTAVVNLRIASSKRYKDKSGTQQEKTTWMSAVAFNKQAEIINQYFQKGSEIYIEGSLEVRNWEDKQGQKRESIEIRIAEFQFVGSKSNTDSGTTQSHAPSQASNPTNQASSGYEEHADWETEDEQIPF